MRRRGCSRTPARSRSRPRRPRTTGRSRRQLDLTALGPQKLCQTTVQRRSASAWDTSTSGPRFVRPGRRLRPAPRRERRRRPARDRRLAVARGADAPSSFAPGSQVAPPTTTSAVAAAARAVVAATRRRRRRRLRRYSWAPSMPLPAETLPASRSSRSCSSVLGGLLDGSSSVSSTIAVSLCHRSVDGPAQLLSQLGIGTACAALHRALSAPEQLCDLGFAEVLPVPQDQNDPLLWRQAPRAPVAGRTARMMYRRCPPSWVQPDRATKPSCRGCRRAFQAIRAITCDVGLHPLGIESPTTAGIGAEPPGRDPPRRRDPRSA